MKCDFCNANFSFDFNKWKDRFYVSDLEKKYCKNCFNKYVGIDISCFCNDVAHCNVCKKNLNKKGRLLNHVFYCEQGSSYFNICEDCAIKMGLW